METYCVSCKKYTANQSSSFRKTKQNRLMLPIAKKQKLFFQMISLK